MQTTITMAGLTVGVEHLYERFRALSEEYVTDAETVDFSVTITPEDIEAEREKSQRECAYEGITYSEYPPELLELTAIYRKIAQHLPSYGALVFHGSAVAVNGETYLFTAPSGTGKTTHTNLWLQHIDGSYVVNGDKPILRMTEAGVFACGTPWRGKEEWGQPGMVPLKAICILRRGAQNTIRPITFSEAMSVLIGQTYRSTNRDVLMDTLRLVEKIGTTVKLYELSCNMEAEAAQVSYRGML